MPQFDYLGTWEDSWGILQAIARPGDVRFVPDLHYEEPHPFLIRDIDDALKVILKERPSVFIWSTMFSKYPPYLERIDSGRDAGLYYVDISRGGPGLHLTLPACYREDDNLHLAPGMLSCQRLWLNPGTERWEKPNKDVKLGYKAIVARMKTQLECYRAHVDIWAGSGALRELQQKKATIHGFGLD
jgi:hypothetical protein